MKSSLVEKIIKTKRLYLQPPSRLDFHLINNVHFSLLHIQTKHIHIFKNVNKIKPIIRTNLLYWLRFVTLLDILWTEFMPTLQCMNRTLEVYKTHTQRVPSLTIFALNSNTRSFLFLFLCFNVKKIKTGRVAKQLYHSIKTKDV